MVQAGFLLEFPVLRPLLAGMAACYLPVTLGMLLNPALEDMDAPSPDGPGRGFAPSGNAGLPPPERPETATDAIQFVPGAANIPFHRHHLPSGGPSHHAGRRIFVRHPNTWYGLLCVPASRRIRPVYVGAMICNFLHSRFGEFPFPEGG